MLARSFVFITLCLSFALLLVATLFGQTFYGSVIGTVTDPSAARIPGASITLVNTGTGERRTALSDEDGAYRFVNLVPGSYKLEVELAGFQRYVRDQIAVNVEAAVRLDVVLRVGSVEETVQVTEITPVLQTEGASVGQVVSSRAVQELPLNGRNVLNLVSLAPGVVPQGSSEGSLTGKNVFAGGNYQIGGGTSNQSATFFDGIPVNDPYGNIVALIPSPDAVGEFKVQTSSNNAEYGRYTGGVVNLVSRSGSNEFHGNLYEFHRNKVLNANDFFANATGAGKAPFVQNQFGGSLGGPIFKDKTFFFVNYEGYRQRKGTLFLRTVPWEPMLRGDFSNYRNAAGQVIPIYDPLTQCGAYGNPACTAAQLAGTDPQRQQFAGNIILQNRISPIAQRFINFPIFAKPNIAGDANGNNNFAKNVSTGGDNDQINIRGDQNVSPRQRLLVRYTRWNSQNLPVDVYGNGQTNGDPYSPEHFVTTQAVIADTYTINPTTILDVRLGFMRWFYDRTPGNVGINIPEKFGLPAYYGEIPALNAVPRSTTVPSIGAAGYNVIGTGLLYARDNTYVFAPSLIKIIGRHELKFGGEARRGDINYYQNNSPGGTFTFSNIFTSRNANNPGATGNSFASFLLGLPASGSVQISPFTAGGSRYQGYYINDTWQATRKLTTTLGVRWEIPGVYTERFDHQVSFNPDLVNPVLEGITNPATGQPFKGAFVLVNTPLHPERGLRPEKFDLLAPRVGLAYRITAKTVVRAGGGIYFVPSTAHFPEGPTQAGVNYVTNNIASTVDNGVTFTNTLSDPLPGGFKAAPGRDPSFQQILLGGTARTHFRNEDFPGYTEQWNLSVQHEFRNGLSVEAAYTGLKGVHLPLGTFQMNQIPLALVKPENANFLREQVTNPFFGKILVGPLSTPTVQRGNLLRPFPHYSQVPRNAYIGDSSYNALQLRAEKRFANGGTLNGSYTFSKNLGNVETLTNWLETGANQGAAGYQTNDLSKEWSLSSFDARHRAVVSYVLDLPFGNGGRYLNRVGGAVGKVINGWSINGSATFQSGFPLGFTASPNLTGFDTGLRPNIVAGCEKKTSGSAQSRLNRWFNTACFTVPNAFEFGNASRTDPELRGHGINNYNFALSKRTAISERTRLEFRAEAFNLFNRVQFAKPNTAATTTANNTFGQVNAQQNDPRQIQLVLRLAF